MSEESKKNDPSRYKWMITINNPLDKGFNHDNIKRLLGELKSIVYWCMADEIGLETHTPHTHIYVAASSSLRFSTFQRRFPGSHIEAARNTAEKNREYIAKTGHWASDPKADTSIPGTFEEWGKMPAELGQGFRSDIAEIYRQISEGLSNAEIMAQNPDAAQHIGKMDKIRQDILEDRYRTTWRDLTVTYIFGPTGTGKTRGIMEEHGYGNVYRVTDYKHPFDRYASEPCLLLDEYRSSLMIGDMLNYLDGYPISLPARYANRVACYETVYIVSNIDLKRQYPLVQTEESATWKAFLRRIHHVIEYKANGSTIDHGTATDYIFPPPKPVPDWVKEAESADDYDELPL